MKHQLLVWLFAILSCASFILAILYFRLSRSYDRLIGDYTDLFMKEMGFVEKPPKLKGERRFKVVAQGSEKGVSMNDELISDNLTKSYALIIARFLNQENKGPYLYSAMPQDYVLFKKA